MEQFIPIIVIAIISLLFNRPKKPANPNREQNRQPNGQPSETSQSSRHELEREDDRGNVFPRPLEDFEDHPLAKARTLKEAADIIRSEAKPAMAEMQAEMDRKMIELQKEEERIRTKTERLHERAKQSAHAAEEKAAPNHPLSFIPDDVVKGIVMAEVLGAPRARKPYNRRVHSK